MTVSNNKIETRVIRLSELPRSRTHDFVYVPDRSDLDALRDGLDLSGLSKVRLTGSLTPVGRRDWNLDGELGATVTQPCVITFDPVRTRLDEPVSRTFREELPDEIPEPEGEVEMPDDDSLEPLPASLDLNDLLAESLELVIPAYPRSAGAELEQTDFAAPGIEPLTDEDARPFAGLAALKDDGKDGNQP